jgi:hypothetical protein
MSAQRTTPAARGGTAPAPRRSRGSYRRQLMEKQPGLAAIGPEARRAAAVVLEVLAGVRTPLSAAAALGVRPPRYYVLEERAIAGLVTACAPRPKGRTVSTERRVARLERELAAARRDLARQQALTRTAQRALGLTAAPAPRAAPAPGEKAHNASAGPRRRRKPAVRALRAARLLCAEKSAGADAPPAVQPAPDRPATAGPAGNGE